jgi:hypothetical protein
MAFKEVIKRHVEFYAHKDRPEGPSYRGVARPSMG